MTWAGLVQVWWEAPSSFVGRVDSIVLDPSFRLPAQSQTTSDLSYAP